ncbi:MAG: NAD(P)H-hydrate dehydratase [Candidatus Omnitrophica bacterium]|nr:NAD(P)H-hydrate dehydratase [Candidatus Omnitrophota bacterium]
MRLPTRLLRRKKNSHKGNFGSIGIFAGSAGFSGAAVLCGWAALRSGAGLVTVGIPRSLNNALIKIKPLELMTVPLSETKEKTLSYSGYRAILNCIRKLDIVVVGPGLSQNKETQKLIRKLVSTVIKPVIIDADGLNALAGHLSCLSGKRIVVLTPHSGEMARLCGIKVDEVEKNRKRIAVDFALKYGITLVLKGAGTIVVDGKKKLYINNTGNPGMATAGSGDVLTGIIASFLAQGLEPFEAAKYAVYIHGLAGDCAAREKTQLGMIASDIIEKIPQAIKLSS